jgi:hypothetical protein
MKKAIIIVSFVFLIFQGFSYQNHGQSRKNIRKYCPESGEVQGWYSEYEPRIARGEDLYLLIDGGADIYFEYGFRDAVFHSYKTKNGNAINLEIYRMNSPESAYGIYTFKTGNTGKPVDSGNDGWMEEYYLNFWKGNFLVTLIGLDMEKETLDGLVLLASSIDAKLSISAERPEIIDILPKTGLKPNGITYLKGNLALFNQYVFDSRDVFGISEGIRGDYGDYDLFLLFYNDPKESLSWFDSAKEILNNNGFFHDLHEEGEVLFMKDQDDQQVVIKPFGNCIIIFLGNPEMDFLPIFETIESRIP